MVPDLIQCWYVDRVIQVCPEYGLTIGRAEADAIDTVLANCNSTEMVALAPVAIETPPLLQPPPRLPSQKPMT